MRDVRSNITFDLECLGRTSNAPIVQIGAVKFEDDGKITDKFIRSIKLKSLSRYDFHMDYETIHWWFSLEDKAIKSVFCTDDAVDLRLALMDFVEWLGAPSEYVYWSHATYDPPILENNFRAVELQNPIPFRAHRDIRTLNHFTGRVEVRREGVHHNALDDCIFQSLYISKRLRLL